MTNSLIAIMKKNNSVYISETKVIYSLIFFGLFAIYLFEGVNKVLIYWDADVQRISLVFRILFQILLLTHLVVFINPTRLFFLLTYLALLITSSIGFFVFISNNNIEYPYLEHFVYYNKYWGALFVIAILRNLDTHYLARLMLYLKAIFLFNSILIFIGWAFTLPFLSSVVAGYEFRFGYSGLLPAGNEATIFLAIGISTFYLSYYKTGQDLTGFIIVLFSSLLSGMKGVYLFLLLLILFHIIYKYSLNYLVIASLFLLTILYFDPVQNWIIEKSTYFVNIYERDGLVTMLFSGRNNQFTNEFLYLINEQWTWLNYLFGGMVTKSYLIEMDLFDLFSFFGLVGFVLYLLIFYFFFLRPIKSVTGHYIIMILLFLGILAGHLLTSSTNSIILPLFIMYISNNFLTTSKGA